VCTSGDRRCPRRQHRGAACCLSGAGTSRSSNRQIRESWGCASRRATFTPVGPPGRTGRSRSRHILLVFFRPDLDQAPNAAVRTSQRAPSPPAPLGPSHRRSDVPAAGAYVMRTSTVGSPRDVRPRSPAAAGIRDPSSYLRWGSLLLAVQLGAARRVDGRGRPQAPLRTEETASSEALHHLARNPWSYGFRVSNAPLLR